MKKRELLSEVFLLLMLAATLHLAAAPPSSFDHFVTVSGDRLMDGNKELRFISFNVPNLHCIEDYLAFEQTNPWRLPDAFEIRDALESVNQMGGTVVRLYTITVRRKDDSPNTPRHVIGPGQFSEEAFRVYDQILAIANEVGVRVIIPFVDNWSWMGGRAEYAGFRHQPSDAFWTDPQIKADFKQTIAFLVQRVNTITGTTYRDDKAILAWETGNELQSPNDWTREMTAYIKKLDPNHLLIDGYHTNVLRDESIANPQVDIVTTHHYEQDPREMVEHIRASAEKAKGKKPYLIGEFGFISTSGIEAVYDLVRQTPHVCGALIWSLRFHARDGGFYWHSEPGLGQYFYKAYHVPGFESGHLYDERNVLNLLRERAYAIRGLEAPALSIPKAPILLPCDDVAKLTWQGSVFASGYDLERANSPKGPWKTLAYDISDATTTHRPLFNDRSAEIGQAYYYRVRARNAAGLSPPSNTIGPIRVRHLTLVDEFFNYGVLFSKNNLVTLQTENARAFKEDAHRLKGEKDGQVVYYTPGAMHQTRIYLFADGTEPVVEVSTSIDGIKFVPLVMDANAYHIGKAEYGYVQPIILSSSTMPLNTRYMKIRFLREAQIARVEIAYGK
ncbi:MAG: hypothetical protein ONB44_24620 [candidate division KSB1 bacterium]|nr:hypothetical protein [candidate division KSB1 bacterium]MDZ7314344.1 hypothetical protein [candidate division KSB1 bacterium]